MLFLLLTLVAPVAIGFLVYDFVTEDDDDSEQSAEDALATPEFGASSISSPGIIGTQGDDTLVGTKFPDKIDGGDGNDTIDGFSSADILLGGAGEDTIEGRGGNDTIRGEQNADRLFGNFGSDLIFGDGGADFIDGGNDKDRIFGGDNADEILGGQGYDELFGEAGNDIIDGGRGYDFVDGGAGADIVSGGKGLDVVIGGQGADTINGGNADDLLVSGELNLVDPTKYTNNDTETSDEAVGGIGNDTIWIGRGDIATGNNGGDEFILSDQIDVGEGGALITDFDFDEGDRLVIQYDPSKYAGIPIVQFSTTELSQVVQVSLDGDEIALLEKAGLGALGSTDDVQLLPLG